MSKPAFKVGQVWCVEGTQMLRVVKQITPDGWPLMDNGLSYDPYVPTGLVYIGEIPKPEPPKVIVNGIYKRTDSDTLEYVTVRSVKNDVVFYEYAPATSCQVETFLKFYKLA
jgi:hypothetical protein